MIPKPITRAELHKQAMDLYGDQMGSAKDSKRIDSQLLASCDPGKFESREGFERGCTLDEGQSKVFEVTYHPAVSYREKAMEYLRRAWYAILWHLGGK